MSEAIREEQQEELEEISVPTGWVCDSDAKAGWALEQIRNARKDRDMWVSWYKQKIEEITAQTDQNTANLERKLFEYFQTVPHRKTKTQEIYQFPGGKLVLKQQEPEFKRDEKSVIEWLKQNSGGQFVKTKEELDWKNLKAACGWTDGKLVAGETVNEDGEIVQIVVPGVEVIEREPKFTVD
jgi:phage host-nuclease inhibitor protein Gam